MSTSGVSFLSRLKKMYDQAAWDEAQEVWDHASLTTPPIDITQDPHMAKIPKVMGQVLPLAWNDLGKRQIVVAHDRVRELQLQDSLPAIYAHELGHHVSFPCMIEKVGQLLVLQARILPSEKGNLWNMFYDIHVNKGVLSGGREGEELGVVYRALGKENLQIMKGFEGYTTCFYFRLQEALLGSKHPLLEPSSMAQMSAKFADWEHHAEATLKTLLSIKSELTQYAFFLVQLKRYLQADGSGGQGGMQIVLDMSQPDPESAGDSLGGAKRQEVEEAIKEAVQRGWVSVQRAQDGNGDQMKVLNSVPGTQDKEFKERLVSHYYKRVVGDYLIEMPGKSLPPEPLVPSTVEEWEPGDGFGLIDWQETLQRNGEMAALHLLKRERLPEEPEKGLGRFPRVEVYLDTSGSMPDPMQGMNAMTLAAQVLVASALREKGVVKLIIYSHGPLMVSDWFRDEDAARRYALNYAGGGTDYPFRFLERSLEEWKGEELLRFVVSDSDFLYNVSSGGKAAKEALLQAGLKGRMILLLNAPPDQVQNTLGEQVMSSCDVVCVEKPEELASAAAQLRDIFR